MRRVGMVGLLGFCAACHSGRDAELRTQLLVAEDQRQTAATVWEPFLLRASSDSIRARAARAVGRLRAPSLGRLLGRAYAVEEEEEVRAELLFAMGQCGGRESIPHLLQVLRGGSGVERARAAEALGKLEDPSVVASLVAHLADGDSRVHGATAMAIVRLRGRRVSNPPPLDSETQRAVLHGLEAMLADVDVRQRWQACYAIAELDLEGRGPALLRAAEDQESAFARFFAAQGLGRLAAQSKLFEWGALVALAEDVDVRVATAAAMALGHGAGEEVREALLRACRRDEDAADFHVRAAALKALAALDGAKHDAATRAAWTVAQRDESATVRAAAMEALAQTEFRAARSLVLGSLASAEALERVAGVRASAYSNFETMGGPLMAAVQDDDVRVVSAVLEVLASLPGAEETARQTFRQALRSDDLAVRGVALVGLRQVCEARDLEAVRTAFAASPGHDDVEVRVEAVRTGQALAIHASVRGAALEFLRAALSDPSNAVVAVAAAALKEVGGPEGRGDSGAEGGGDPGAVPGAGREVAPRPTTTSSVAAPSYPSGFRPRVRLRTTKGTIVLRMLADQAPRHVASFLARARDGAHDGLPFHRVVSNFVVQGFDPRGDGWGTGGVFLRDEINPQTYEVGTVGMPNIGPDSGGCQLFITSVPTPHLDGRYTVFAQVEKGMEVVNALEVGDLCVEVRVLD